MSPLPLDNASAKVLIINLCSKIVINESKFKFEKYNGPRSTIPRYSIAIAKTQLV